jgi:internalin A
MLEQKEKKAWHEAIRRIEQASRSNAAEIDLAGLGLDAIPEQIATLAHLDDLDASNNKITQIPDFITRLTHLSQISLDNNLITKIPDSLATLKELNVLSLSDNQIPAIPDSLAEASSLRFLALDGNQLAQIPDWLGQRLSLEYLFLYGNQISAIPDSLANAVSLKTLYLSGNRITTIPDSLGALINLTKLALDDNRITTLPRSFGRLRSLEELDFGGNDIIVIPDFIQEHDNLRKLAFRENSISTLPDALGQLRKLESLDVSDNLITAVPESLATLPNLSQLFLHGNPALGIPDEVLGPRWFETRQGKAPKPPKEIFTYIFSKGRPLNEAKLILVGQGGVGKTSLVKTITGKKFKKGEKATEGIKISDWACELNKTNTITVHIWDFGGQEMMHATHQFFLTERSLYLMVLNRRPGGIDREADYWLRLIRQFGGKNAPVIIVLNKHKDEPFNVNRGGLLQKYAENIKGFIETDCEDNESISRLRNEIRRELQAMGSLKTSFPERWFAIKDTLSQMNDQYLTYENYRQICTDLGEKDPERQKSLAGFLHDLGIALNYKDDPRLRFAYVLKPEWVTEGIYALLHAFVKTKGLFTRSEAERVLGSKGYEPKAADFIMGLMEQFEVSFPLGDSQKRGLIPQLLEDQQPNEAREFDATKCLNFAYKYEIVPEGLLPRFIARTHHISKAAGRWKSGVILHDSETGCRALVRADSTIGLVSIHVDGPEHRRRDLLAIIRYNFQMIHADNEFRPAELVYAEGMPEKHFPLSELNVILRDDANSTVSVVLPDNKVMKPTVASLVEPVKGTLEPLKLFLSYSHRDKKYVDELRKALKPAERSGLVQSWYDGEITAGEEWKPLIEQRLREADVIVCQLSRDFLSSDFCMLNELETAIQRREAGEAALVAYILHDCDWKEVPKLAKFQILPCEAKSIDDRQNKHKYWMEISDGLKEAIKKHRQQRPTRSLQEGKREKDK